MWDIIEISRKTENASIFLGSCWFWNTIELCAPFSYSTMISKSSRNRRKCVVAPLKLWHKYTKCRSNRVCSGKCTTDQQKRRFQKQNASFGLPDFVFYPFWKSKMVYMLGFWKQAVMTCCHQCPAFSWFDLPDKRRTKYHQRAAHTRTLEHRLVGGWAFAVESGIGCFPRVGRTNVVQDHWIR